MYKRIAALGLALVFVLSLTACGSMPYSDYDLEDYITVGEYKGLEVEKYTIEVTDEEVQAEIQNRLQQAASTTEVEEGVVEEGDTVVIDFVGRIDGEEFEGGSAQNYSLTIGGGQFVDGFESGLIGAQIGGDPVVVTATFPEDYSLNEDLAGKEAEFTVTVHSKQVTKVPDLDMDFIKATGSKAADLEEYNEEVREDLYKKKEEEAINNQKTYLWNKVVESTEQAEGEDGEALYPEEEITRVTDEYIAEYQNYADQYGMEFGDFIEQQTGLTEDEFNEQIKEYAKSIVLQEMVLYYLVDQENIKISKDEYKQYIEDQLADMGMDAETFENAYGKSFEEYIGEDTIRRYIYTDKVATMMLDNAVQVDELSEDDAADDEAKDDEDKDDESKDNEAESDDADSDDAESEEDGE